jgi:hypothetical protein
MKTLRSLYIACAAFLGFDVRFTRKGKAYFLLRDKRAERKRLRKIRKLNRTDPE